MPQNDVTVLFQVKVDEAALAEAAEAEIAAEEEEEEEEEEEDEEDDEEEWDEDDDEDYDEDDEDEEEYDEEEEVDENAATAEVDLGSESITFDSGHPTGWFKFTCGADIVADGTKLEF